MTYSRKNKLRRNTSEIVDLFDAIVSDVPAFKSTSYRLALYPLFAKVDAWFFDGVDETDATLPVHFISTFQHFDPEIATQQTIEIDPAVYGDFDHSNLRTQFENLKTLGDTLKPLITFYVDEQWEQRAREMIDSFDQQKVNAALVQHLEQVIDNVDNEDLVQPIDGILDFDAHGLNPALEVYVAAALKSHIRNLTSL